MKPCRCIGYIHWKPVYKYTSRTHICKICAGMMEPCNPPKKEKEGKNDKISTTKKTKA